MEIKKIYLVFVFGLIIFGTGIASAAAPNPGHLITEIEKCNANETLKMNSNGNSWTCSSSSGSSQWTTNGNNIYYDVSGGNVGIRTSSPQYRLHVEGTSYFNSDVDSTHSVFGNSGGEDSEAIYGQATGRGGVGVYGQATGGVLSKGVYGEGAGSGTNYGVYAKALGSTNWALYCYSGNGAHCGGNIPWEGSSDSRLKQDIKTIQNPLDKVLDLRGVTFYWKDDKKKENPEMGFIAQETLPLIPEVVSTGPDGYYTMQTSQITALLVEAVKEQQDQIEQLKKENAELQKSAWEQHREISDLKNAICEISPTNEIC